jgi:hypothetical protein
LLLRLEGHARGLSRLLQAKDRSLLLLDGLALICEGDAQLGQFPIESRNFLTRRLRVVCAPSSAVRSC